MQLPCLESNAANCHVNALYVTTQLVCMQLPWLHTMEYELEDNGAAARLRCWHWCLTQAHEHNYVHHCHCRCYLAGHAPA